MPTIPTTFFSSATVVNSTVGTETDKAASVAALKAYAAALANFTGANQSLSSNGYQKLPGGLIIQWMSGSSMNSQSTQSINWPIPFPNAVLKATVSRYNTSSPGGTTVSDIGFSFLGTSTVTVWTGNNGGGVAYASTPMVIGIGY